MNLATLITLSRMALVPVMLVTFFSEYPNHYCYALAIFLIAVISDGLDGFLARLLNQVTQLGANLDALADKILMLSGLFCLLSQGILIPLLVFSMFFRDMLADWLRNFLIGTSEPYGTNLSGKAKFLLQSVSICLALLAMVDARLSPLIVPANIALALALLVSLPGLRELWIAFSKRVQFDIRKSGAADMVDAFGHPASVEHFAHPTHDDLEHERESISGGALRIRSEWAAGALNIVTLIWSALVRERDK